MNFSTREAWLIAATELLGELFAEIDIEVPEVRVSCGWPSVSARSASRKRIGECWKTVATEDGVAQIFVSPVLGKTIEVLETLAHELVHAVDDCESGHQGAFAKTARRIGLEGKMTSTHAGPGLLERFEPILERLGEYPHSAINLSGGGSETPKKQTTRMLKMVCPNTGYIARTTQKWIDEYGTSLCPCCRVEMELEVKE